MLILHYKTEKSLSPVKQIGQGCYSLHIKCLALKEMTRHKRLFSEHVCVQSKASGVGCSPTVSLTAESFMKHASHSLFKAQA